MRTGRHAHHRVVLESGSKQAEMDPGSAVDFGPTWVSPHGERYDAEPGYDPEDPYDDGTDYGDEER